MNAEENHVVDHINEIVVLLDSVGVGLNCPQLFYALIELATYVAYIQDYPNYQTRDLINRFREEHSAELMERTALGEKVDAIQGPDDIKPGTVVH
jgi:hypothetical protein